MTISRALVLVLFAATVHAQDSSSPTISTATLEAGVPLHLRVTQTVPIDRGYAVTATLTEDIYAIDRVVLPKGTKLRGVITSLEPIHGLVKTQAILNGDVTPLHQPVVHFEAAILPDGRGIECNATARIRETQMVNFTPAAQRPSLYSQAKAMVKERIQSTRDAVFAPGKKDRVLKLVYSQFPYHPQRLWAGTQLIADLDTPAQVPIVSAVAPISSNDAGSLNGLDVRARLTSALDSHSTRKGADVSAIVTQPVFGADHTLLLAEGTTLRGIVLSSKRARCFGRNGELHFGIRSVERTGVEEQHVQGTLTGAEGSKDQNLTVDREGNAKSNPDKNRFIAPLLLAVLATAGHDDDHHGHADGDGNLGGETVASNGLGLVARVVALASTNANVATGFGAYAFAKSITFRFLVRGHEVTFPKDTLVTVRLTER